MKWRKLYIVFSFLNPLRKDNRKKYNIQGDIGALLGKNWEVEKMIRFLKKTEMFEEI